MESGRRCALLLRPPRHPSNAALAGAPERVTAELDCVVFCETLRQAAREAGTDTTLTRNWNMADKRSLGLLGFLFGGITVVVSLTAFLVVRAHIEGHLQFADAGLASQVTVVSDK